MKAVKKIWSVLSTIIVVLIVLLAIALVGVRVIGWNVFTVLSGSMEPTYHVGSVIYVKPVDASEVEIGDPITYVLNEDLLVSTHRVVGIETDEDGTIRFRTKGDANEAEDGGLVHERNLIGVPVFSVPYLGYFASYVRQPPGTYIVIAVVAFLILLMFLPQLIGAFLEDEKKPEDGKAEELPEGEEK